MNSKLNISPTGINKVHQEHEYATPFVLRGLVNLLSYVFHPVFVPLYVIAFLLFVEPFLFIGASFQAKVLTLGRAFVNYTFFPLVSVLLLRGLNLIGSIKLENRKDRVVPFVVCSIWYFWIWYVWRGLPGVPHYFVVFSFSVFIASSVGLLANIYIKISMHGIAWGTATAFLVVLTLNAFSSNITLYLACALLVSGLVGTARLLLFAHTPREYYWGLIVGALGVLIACAIA